MPVPALNVMVFVGATALFVALLSLIATHAGRRAAINAAGWAVVGLAGLAWVAFHDYVGEPLGTALSLAALMACGLIVADLLRRLVGRNDPS